MKFKLRLKPSHFRLVHKILKESSGKSEILKSKDYIQHKDTTVFEHSLNVTFLSLRIAQFLGINIDAESMVKGALFHDYFMYDWHDREFDRPKWHAFTHPMIAHDNANKVWELNSIEADCIKNHMFPVTFPAPKTKEGWIVSMADKMCTFYDSWKIHKWGGIW